LKNNKAAGHDGITGEMLKAADDSFLNKLLEIFNLIWIKEHPPPQQWKDGIIIRIPKKGDLSDCNNWRGITLLSIPGKVFCSILLNRIKKSVDAKLREEQNGFRSGRSCINHIFTLRTIIEESNEFRSKLVINFVDFQKAFDSIHQQSLWEILGLYGFPPKYINIIKSLYNISNCCVRTHHGNSEWFQVATGVKQGCVLSPLLFNIAIDWVMRQSTSNLHLGIPWLNKSTLEDLDFADDLAILSETPLEAQMKTERLELFSNQIGLQINASKTKIMYLNNTHDAIKLKDLPIEPVTKFTYLGSKLAADGDLAHELTTRLALSAMAFNKLSNIWKSSKISTKLKLRLFNSCVIPVLTYACESWKSTLSIDHKLNSFENKCLRRITNTHWKDFKTNALLRAETKQPYISDIIRRRRWAFIGHTLRSDPNNIHLQALSWTPQGSRKRGRPKETLRRTITREYSSVNIKNLLELQHLAAHRQDWRAMTSALCAIYSTKGK
jgi:hypothetical protein